MRRGSPGTRPPARHRSAQLSDPAGIAAALGGPADGRLAGEGLQGDFFANQPPSFPGLDRPADRICVIDVGSNSVRMVVFEGDCRSPAVLFNERVMCGLGARLAETGALDPKAKLRAIGALRRFAAIAPGLHVGAMAAVATAAVRDATDGREFCAEAERQTGIRLRIATGAEEARLGALGVVFGNPTADGVVIDLGGASMELCRVNRGRPGRGVTTPLGPLRLVGAGKRRAIEAEIAENLEPQRDAFHLGGGRLYLVGGSWRALAKANMMRVNYPLQVLHEYTLAAPAALEVADWVAKSKPEALAALPGVSENRAPVLPLCGSLLRKLVEVLEPGEVMFSGFGLREGLALEHVPLPRRGDDPLIAACEAQEALRARSPGFGRELAAWVREVLPPRDAAEDRLIEAAARLVDVNWRTHPDYRVASSWETVTRTTITDIGHSGRVFIGAVLSTRYKRNRKLLEQSGMLGLIDPESLERAIRLGFAFRLGTVLAGATPGVLPLSRFERDGSRLELVLTGHAVEFAGEEVEKRLRQFGKELGLDASMRISDI